MSAFVSTLFARLRSLVQYPDSEPPDYPFSVSDIAKLHRVTADPSAASLDEQTWKDLLLDAYSERLSPELSIFGRQMLHRRLREGLDDVQCAALGERLRALTDNPERLQQLHRTVKPLRHADIEVAGLLFEEASPPPAWWAGRSWPLPLGLIVSIAAVTLTPLAWIGAGVALYFLMAAQMRYSERVQAWERSMHALQMMLRVSSLLGASTHPLAQQFTCSRERAGAVNRQLSRSFLVQATPGAMTYADWFLLGNVEHYFKTIGVVADNRAFLRECFILCADLESDIALARHLLSTSLTCRAVRLTGSRIALDQAVHPLLERAAPLSLALDGKGAFVSGQNGIGKSTLLRTVGLNLVVARAFGFCYARSAEVSTLPVYASMQSEDSLFGGESLYIAELRRAQELLAAAEGPHRGIYIIDEIFRGTNHLESVSAAAAVLDVLAAKGVVIVSSHNLMLASLLAHRLTPLCVSMADDGLALAPGVLAHTNGIALLAARGFDAQVEANAGRVFDWLSGYLAHPVDSAHVLAGRAS